MSDNLNSLIKLLISPPDPNSERQAINSLRQINDPRTSALLIDVLMKTSDGIGPQKSAAYLLGERKDLQSVDTLIKLLSNEDGDLKIEAIEALAKIGDGKAVAPLVSILTNSKEESRCRSAATHSLGLLKADRALSHIIAALKDKEPGIRSSAAEALGDIGNLQAVDDLINALNDDTASVRSRAAVALGKMKASHALDSLIQILNDKDSVVCEKAIFALSSLGDKRAINPIVGSLRNKTSFIRKAAAAALNELGFIPSNQTEEVRYYFALQDWNKLKEIGHPAKDMLVDALSYKDKDVHDGAAMVLKHIGWKPTTVEQRQEVKTLKQEDNENRTKTKEGLLQVSMARIKDGMGFVVVGLIGVGLAFLAHIVGLWQLYIAIGLLFIVPMLKEGIGGLFQLFYGIGLLIKAIMSPATTTTCPYCQSSFRVFTKVSSYNCSACGEVLINKAK